MRIRHLLMRRHFIAGSLLLTFLYYQLSRFRAFVHKVFIGRYVVLHKGAKIGIHYKSQIKLVNSRIIVHAGDFKIGLSYGFFDRATIPSSLLACRLNLVNSELHIYGDVSLFPGSAIDIENGKVSIGANTILNPNTSILCKKEIEIGSDCLFAPHVTVRDDDGHKYSTNEEAPSARIEPVKIGNKCWFGQGVTVLKGVHIGDGCIVAAGSLVNKDIAPGVLSAGVPAKPIYSGVSWEP